jgi:hypothetical protein
MLTEHQVIVLRALVDAIIPPDSDPGGWDGGVGTYLFQQFERDLADFVGMYQQGLLALDAEAKEVMGEHFAALAPDERETLLTKVERGQVQTVWSVDPGVFFATVITHCAEGFYSDPSNGGNQAGAAWKMIGFEVTA